AVDPDAARADPLPGIRAGGGPALREDSLQCLQSPRLLDLRPFGHSLMVQYGGKLQTGPILIRGARQLLTLRGPKGPRRGPDLNELGIIPDGALRIRDGLIEEVGPSRRLENLAAARGAIEVSALTRVVMPGFVDSHTHLIFPPHGSSGDDTGAALRALRTT